MAHLEHLLFASSVLKFFMFLILLILTKILPDQHDCYPCFRDEETEAQWVGKWLIQVHKTSKWWVGFKVKQFECLTTRLNWISGPTFLEATGWRWALTIPSSQDMQAPLSPQISALFSNPICFIKQWCYSTERMWVCDSGSKQQNSI